MLGWLGEWLTSIVVVVLLAVVVELVLPNSKMLRYSRLVIGLILMLTMLNPILQIFHTDFHEKLTASFSLWEKELASKERSVPSLDDITKEAEHLKQVRQEAAVDVTRASLEQAIMQELKAKTEANVQAVKLELGWSKQLDGQQMPYIDSVIVTLQLSQDEQATPSPQETAQDEVIVKEVEQISIPAIAVQVKDEEDDIKEEPAAHTHQEMNSNENQLNKFQEHATEIQRIIAAGWNVKADHVFVQAS